VTTGPRAPDTESVWQTYLGLAPERTVATGSRPPHRATDSMSASGARDGRPVQVAYPKRSELRRAERGRRGSDRRPLGGRPSGFGPHPAHPGQHSHSSRGGRPTEPRPGPTPPLLDGWPLPEPRRDTPSAGLTTARLSPEPPPHSPATGTPLIQWGTSPLLPQKPDELRTPDDDPFTAAAPETNPRGLSLGADTAPVTRVTDALAPAGPVTSSMDPAVWAPDVEPRRRGRRRDAETAEPSARSRRGATRTLPVMVRGKAGAARLLVLALVVGFEGVAITSMTRTNVRSAPDPADGEFVGASAVLAEAGTRHRAAAQATAEALALAQAQQESGGAKVADAMRQAQAAADRVKAAAQARARALRNAQRNPKAIARIMVADRGWSASQFTCLDKLWIKESQWNYRAQNPSSGAYGIPQALPGTKMASAGSDWRTNPVTQIEWGLDYIADRYGTPCAAWGHSQDVGWY
jgi:murein DD-endopeptidase MepM/ murein hydrolase activator NlpD